MNFKEKLLEYKNESNKELEAIFDEYSKEQMSDIVKENYDYIKTFVLNGGKRLRPAVTINAFHAVGGTGNIARAAMSVELLHNSTLLHDDFMDGDVLRRGKATCHVYFKDWFTKKHQEQGSERFGTAMAVLDGNILFIQALRALADNDFPANRKAEAISIYSQVYEFLNRGQIEDIYYENNVVGEKEYLDMIRFKTGMLFTASIEMGAVLGGATNEQRNALVEYIMPIAQAFQIQDDILGSFGKSDKTGKSTKGDIENAKQTLLYIKAREKLGQETLDNYFGRELTDEEADAARKMLVDSGAVDYCKTKCKELAEQAKKELDKAEFESEPKQFFIGLADHLINREY